MGKPQRNQIARKSPGVTVQTMHQLHPGADTALKHSNAHELLFATMLSAQSTDARVNLVTEQLFKKYRTVKDFAETDPDEFQKEIRSTGFFRNKTKHILAIANKIIEDYHGKVPDTMEELLTLPGVARKMVNVVLGTYFRKPEGFVVDTHVKRVTYRLELTDHKDLAKIEKDLMEVFPREEWIFMGHALILHGREYCTARNPKWAACPLGDVCAKRSLKR